VVPELCRLTSRGDRVIPSRRVAAERFAEVTGTLPTHTADAQSARSAANTRQRVVEIAFEASNNPEPEQAWFAESVGPALAGFTLPVIAKATGVSTSAAAKWRAGLRVPHRRHRASLAGLVGVELPTSLREARH